MPVVVGLGTYLQQVVRRVVQGHDERSCADVVGKPGEADEDDGSNMVDDLLFEVLRPGKGEGGRLH